MTFRIVAGIKSPLLVEGCCVNHSTTTLLTIISIGYTLKSHVGLSRGKPLLIIFVEHHMLKMPSLPLTATVKLSGRQKSGTFKMEYVLMSGPGFQPESLSGVDD